MTEGFSSKEISVKITDKFIKEVLSMFDTFEKIKRKKVYDVVSEDSENKSRDRKRYKKRQMQKKDKWEHLFGEDNAKGL